MKDLETLQQQAEQNYSCGKYKEAKRTYEQMLLLTLKGTLKRLRVLDCISDMQKYIENDLKGLNEAIQETELIETLKDIIK